MHPHSRQDLSRAERDAVTIANQRVLIDDLERTVRTQQRWIIELETLAGRDKLTLHAEIERLRRDLRDLNARLNDR